jgi:antitoxin (DNA-binding transcriptional repressor) of toxin-antitoxin stability system
MSDATIFFIVALWHYGTIGDGIMKEISIREARQIVGKLDKLLIEEGEISITRRGKPIAKVTSIEPVKPMPSHKKLRNAMPTMKHDSTRFVRDERDNR